MPKKSGRKQGTKGRYRILGVVGKKETNNGTEKIAGEMDPTEATYTKQKANQERRILKTSIKRTRNKRPKHAK